MEIGTPFIAVVLYSLVGYIVFQGASLLAVAYIANNSESISKGRVVAVFGTVMALAVASGPLTWGNLLRRALIRKEEASQ